ncbi:hypothetical protein COEX109129_07235 [Corallococcus exiguus]
MASTASVATANPVNVEGGSAGPKRSTRGASFTRGGLMDTAQGRTEGKQSQWSARKEPVRRR